MSHGADVVAAATADDSLCVWRLVDAGEVAVLRGRGRSLRAAAASPDASRVAATFGDGTARVWRTEAPGEVRALRGRGGSADACAFFPGGARVVVGSLDGSLRIWDVDEEAAVRTLAGDGRAVVAVAVSPHGDRLLAASGGAVWLHALDGAGGPVKLAEGWDDVAALAFTTDGAAAVVHGRVSGARVVPLGGTARVCGPPTGAAIRSSSASARGPSSRWASRSTAPASSPVRTTTPPASGRWGPRV